jgi:hypothetical protein
MKIWISKEVFRHLKVLRWYSPGQASDKYGRRLFFPTELISTNNALLLHQPDRIFVDVLENSLHTRYPCFESKTPVTSQLPVSVVTTLDNDVTATDVSDHDIRQ